ncbi:putative membrane protein required for colicin V production [Paenibacillus forsythiae]|uniref:Membrane protein required for colicin V production n=2 Tax=Paenibacillus forsythiae TaxID=365616 RepID=A0ABU3HBM7_9BACL|nr:transglutaminase domain-containing protein [Paenibacillus forsythiae]MDT3427861.1 putative membrane protein required for colicin V production [Paenibacillus forsythiae]
MVNEWLQSLRDANIITIILLLIVALSLIQGWFRGFSLSASRLFGLLGSGILTISSLVLAALAAAYFSPYVQTWAAGTAAPKGELNQWQQIYYTAVSALAGLPLLRFLFLLMAGYTLIRIVLGLVALLLPIPRFRKSGPLGERKISAASRFGGAGIGVFIGVVRCLLLIIILYVGTGLSPSSDLARYIEESPVYRQSVESLIEPVTGTAVQDKLPVLTKAVAAEMNDILRRKYEIIDRDVSSDITAAAADIAGKAESDEDKARLLYDWVGTRISYDYAKAENYEQNRIWKEQTPQDTFDTRLGVCIDYARLYAVMARSQGLDVRVVTGRGYDGRGGYGPHAWNEVYIPKREAWIPLDSTWARSGDWFNPADFDSTHIKESVL